MIRLLCLATCIAAWAGTGPAVAADSLKACQSKGADEAGVMACVLGTCANPKLARDMRIEACAQVADSKNANQWERAIAHVHRGLIGRKSGQPDLVLADYFRAREAALSGSKPSEPNQPHHLAQTQAANAVEEFRRAIRSDLIVGVIGAEDFIKKAEERGYRLRSLAYADRGLAYVEKGDMKRAIEDYYDASFLVSPPGNSLHIDPIPLEAAKSAAQELRLAIEQRSKGITVALDRDPLGPLRAQKHRICVNCR